MQINLKFDESITNLMGERVMKYVKLVSVDVNYDARHAELAMMTDRGDD